MIGKKTIISTSIGIVLLGLVFFVFVDIGEVIQTLVTVNLPIYLLAVACIGCSILFWSYRWKTLINVRGYGLKVKNVIGALTVGFALNNITPFAKLGGEPVRAYILEKKNGVNYTDGLASVLVDGSVYLITTQIFVIISLLFLPLVMSPPTWLAIGIITFEGIMILFLFSFLGIYFDRNYILRFIDFFAKRIDFLKKREDKIIKKYREFQIGFQECLQNKSAMGIALSSAFLGKVLNLVAYYFIFISLGYQIPLLHIFVIMGLLQIALTLPITPGSLGIYEGVFISGFVLLNVPVPIAASGVLLQRLIWFWGITAVGGALGIHYSINFSSGEGVVGWFN